MPRPKTDLKLLDHQSAISTRLAKKNVRTSVVPVRPAAPAAAPCRVGALLLDLGPAR